MKFDRRVFAALLVAVIAIILIVHLGKGSAGTTTFFKSYEVSCDVDVSNPLFLASRISNFNCNVEEKVLCELFFITPYDWLIRDKGVLRLEVAGRKAQRDWSVLEGQFETYNLKVCTLQASGVGSLKLYSQSGKLLSEETFNYGG